jgi:hypothetical protein
MDQCELLADGTSLCSSIAVHFYVTLQTNAGIAMAMTISFQIPSNISAILLFDVTQGYIQ